LDTSEPWIGTWTEQSIRNPRNEPDFTIATSPETDFIFRGKSRSEVILGRKIFPVVISSKEMPPERLINRKGVNSPDGKQFSDWFETPKGEFPSMEISGRRVHPTGDVIGTDESLFF
jgi:hypothetical protein